MPFKSPSKSALAATMRSADTAQARTRALAALSSRTRLPHARVEKIFEAALLSVKNGPGDPPQPIIDLAVLRAVDRLAFEAKPQPT